MSRALAIELFGEEGRAPSISSVFSTKAENFGVAQNASHYNEPSHLLEHSDTEAHTDDISTLELNPWEQTLRQRIINSIHQGHPEHALEMLERLSLASQSEEQQEYIQELALEAYDELINFGYIDEANELANISILDFFNVDNTPSDGFIATRVEGELVYSPQDYEDVLKGKDRQKNGFGIAKPHYPISGLS